MVARRARARAAHEVVRGACVRACVRAMTVTGGAMMQTMQPCFVGYPFQGKDIIILCPHCPHVLPFSSPCLPVLAFSSSLSTCSFFFLLLLSFLVFFFFFLFLLSFLILFYYLLIYFLVVIVLIFIFLFLLFFVLVVSLLLSSSNISYSYSYPRARLLVSSSIFLSFSSSLTLSSSPFSSCSLSLSLFSVVLIVAELTKEHYNYIHANQMDQKINEYK